MRIAQVAPLAESIPPTLYGGTERVVHWLTEGLVARGHEVTLFASGDSRTSARLVPCSPRALRLAGVRDQMPWLHGLIREVFEAARDGAFDLIHSHVDHHGFFLSSALSVPVVHTMHGRMDDGDALPLYQVVKECALVSISNSQRLPLPGGNWIATIHHGMPKELLPFSPRPRNEPYVLFLGRISPEKRPDLAIAAARLAGMPLKIAAKVDPVDRLYFETEIAPLLAGDGVEFLGEVDDARKTTLLGEATALLFPIDWPEPFGLVAIESLACGTPVVTRPCGALPEIVKEGETGLFAVDAEGLARAIVLAKKMDRSACRATFEERFSLERMLDGYEAVYERLTAERRRPALSGT